MFQNLGGLGQGNGAGPSSWHSHCLVLVKAYEIMTNERVTFQNPQSRRKFIQWLVGYVDDNTLLTKLESTNFIPQASHEMIKKAQNCLEVWQCLIHITGGEIELEKSCLSMITWKEAKGMEVLCTIEYSPEELWLKSIKYPGLEVKIKRNEVNKGEQILGVRLALDGNNEAEFKYRKKQARDLAGKISSPPFSRGDAEVIYKERWIPPIGYCLPITQFTQNECHKIQAPFYQAILPKMGFNRHIPTEIRFGPKKYNGKGLVDLTTYQVSQHVEKLIEHLRQNDQTGNILLTQLETHQFLIGLENLFLTLDPKVYAYGEKSRPQFLWEQCFFMVYPYILKLSKWRSWHDKMTNL